MQQQLSQQMQALSLYGGAEPPPPYHLVPPPPPPSYTASIVSRQSPTQQDYRKSPSSGIYSGEYSSVIFYYSLIEEYLYLLAIVFLVIRPFFLC